MLAGRVRCNTQVTAEWGSPHQVQHDVNLLLEQCYRVALAEIRACDDNVSRLPKTAGEQVDKLHRRPI